MLDLWHMWQWQDVPLAPAAASCSRHDWGAETTETVIKVQSQDFANRLDECNARCCH